MVVGPRIPADWCHVAACHQREIFRAHLETLTALGMGIKGSKDVQLNDVSKIERRMVEAMRKRAKAGPSPFKSFNSILMKFPKIDKSFEQVRGVFKKFDKDDSGTIDLEELKTCFRELQVEFTDTEVKAFHEESDMDKSKGVDFKEFIIVLALVYLLGETGAKPVKQKEEDKGKGSQLKNLKSRIGLAELESTFETIVDTFRFFDKDGDGYVSRKEMITAINEASPGQSSSGESIGVKRFEEMDWDKNGMITFKEFLFAFTDWVGIEEEEDADEDEEE
ncbi:probable calcium-binding protein CML21 [Selaginella moellendorffii]|nr:probable calcium-binding protein CML21 [Selaginella moellendorffii]|eukprot:XP_002982786.2 probable calcium-binding protein CML21 [Selaginella moellendorffii]